MVLRLFQKTEPLLLYRIMTGVPGRRLICLASKGFKVAGYPGAKYYEEAGDKLTKIVPPAPKPNADAK